MTLFDAVPPQVTLFADGGSRGNPGPAASGAVIVDGTGAVVDEVGEYLGIATNNVAEWTALCIGLEAAAKHGYSAIAVRMDSELVVKQLLGQYRVKQPHLVPLYRRARALLTRFGSVDVKHVPRKQNALADALVNAVLDQEAQSPSS